MTLYLLIDNILKLLPLIVAARILFIIDRAAKKRQDRVSYYLVDFFSLLFMVQLPLAIIFRKISTNQNAQIFVGSVLGTIMLVVWWMSIRAVSRAGIHEIRPRACMSIIVIPMMFIGSFAIYPLGIMIVDKLGQEPNLGMILLEVTLIGLMLFSWWYTRRVVQEPAGANTSIPQD